MPSKFLLRAVGLASIIASSPLRAADLEVPGRIIDHSPAASGIYLGSPGICILPDGTYLAKCDEFGPGSTESTEAVTRLFQSGDRGVSWERIATVKGIYWASIFYHHGAVYLLGTHHQNGPAVIRKSTDQGKTWTIPLDAQSGLLRGDGRYHCAPVPVVVHQGRIWRAMEDAMGPGGWGEHFRAFMMSAPVDADLLDADQWTFSNRLERNPLWLDGTFRGWLEGNAVVTPAGQIVNVLRVDTRISPGVAAMIRISPDGKWAAFDNPSGFIAMPGGCKKFTIRFDPATELYWSLVNWIPPRHRQGIPGTIRNTLAVVASPDLLDWEVRCAVLYHPDPARHGFQYVDWLFEGNDLVAAVRTAYDDDAGGAHNYHDANFLTFHRIRDFRTLEWEDSVADLTSPPSNQ